MNPRQINIGVGSAITEDTFDPEAYPQGYEVSAKAKAKAEILQMAGGDIDLRKWCIQMAGEYQPSQPVVPSATEIYKFLTEETL